LRILFFLLGRFEVGVGGFMFVVASSFGDERQRSLSAALQVAWRHRTRPLDDFGSKRLAHRPKEADFYVVQHKKFWKRAKLHKNSNIFAQKFGGLKKWLYLCSAKRKKYGSYSNKAQMFVKTSNCP